MLLFELLFLLAFHPAKPELVNVFIQKNVDLQTQLTKISTKIIFRNLQNDHASNYMYLLDPDVTNYYISFTNDQGVALYHEPKTLLINGRRRYTALMVYYQDSFRYLHNIELNVEEVHVGKVKQMHKKKQFGLPDLVSYMGNVYYFSAYESLKCNVSYLINNAYQVNIPPLAQNNETADYFFEKLKPFTGRIFYIEFHTKSVFFHVLDLKRTIDVSPYGKVMVTEDIVLKNAGAAAYGPFKVTRDKWLYTHLPSSADNIVLYDEIGTIYTFIVLRNDLYVTLQFKPRFQLQGGWQTTYTISYMVPLHQYTKRSSEHAFELRMRAFDHVLNDAVIDKFETRVILPEASQDIQNDVPPIFESFPMETTLTHLSWQGRPTIRFMGRNVIEDQIEDFTIKYHYDSYNLLLVPIKLSLFYYTTLGSIVFTRRMFAVFTINP